MLKLQKAKLQHFPGDVEDVEVAGEIFGGGGQFSLQLQHLQHLQRFPGNLEASGFLAPTSSTFSSFKHVLLNVLKTGEMLKMLKLQKAILQHFPGNIEDVEVAGEISGGGVSEFPLQLQHFQHLQHFPGSFGFSNFNIFNISPVLSRFVEKVLKTGEMLKMLKFAVWMPPQNFPCNFNIFNICWEMLKIPPLQLQHLQHFPCFRCRCQKNPKK